MGGIKLKVHPLFFLFGLFYALTGKIFMFLICTVSAVIHEIGHAIMAEKCGYKLNKITLMPFGAVVSGNINGLSKADQLKIALAGPFINVVIALIFVALWWFFPETYAYTDTAVQTNLSLAIINLIPAYPLDGGRVLNSILSLKLKEKTSERICKITGVIFAVILFVIFVLTIFIAPNFSILFFALFIFFGAIEKNKENRYVRIYNVLNKENLKRGVKVKNIAVDKSITVKRLLSLIDSTCVNEVMVFSNGEKIKTLSQKELNQVLFNGNVYSTIENGLKSIKITS